MRNILRITDRDFTGSDKLSTVAPRMAVNAVLSDGEGNVAICYMGGYDLHTLPGGGLEPGEDFLTALRREIWEETGCECEITGELGRIVENRAEQDFTQERYYYTARVVGEKGSLHLTDKEIANQTTVLWMPLEKALRIISEKEHDDYQRKFIKKRDVAVLTEALMESATREAIGEADGTSTSRLRDVHIQRIDGVPFKLKAPFDFSFLKKYGRVFKVFDNQDSGNICFGVQDGEKRYFVKFAGAPTVRACVSAQEAVDNLKCAAPVYRDLSHPNLVKLIDSEDTNGGYALIFEWRDAECMHRMYPQSREKFLRMPTETRLLVFDEILDFHLHAAKRGYVAIDFYDGSIMYDFGERKTIICDIDFCAQAPYVNNMGRLWGSSRFMSPEEFQLGAVIDEITNVYTMGATAFALFADSDRSREAWPLSRDLYAVVKRAVSDERERRQQSIERLIEEWRAAK